MMRVIINADDFGINEIVTREIEKLIKTGAISSQQSWLTENLYNWLKR